MIGAHIDSVGSTAAGRAPGADDNCSGTVGPIITVFSSVSNTCPSDNCIGYNSGGIPCTRQLRICSPKYHRIPLVRGRRRRPPRLSRRLQ